MAKRLLCVIVFMLTLVCTFASCSGDKDETPSHTHNFGEWEITKSATCTAEGSKERYCSCGEKQTAVIGLKEHEYGEWSITKEATFTENGEEIHSCVCGKTETRIVAKKVEPITSTLTKEQYISEIEILFGNIKNQDTLWFNDGDWIYARYFDGNEFFTYSYTGKDEDGWKKIHCGKVGNEYLNFVENINTSSESKVYSTTTKSTIENFIEYMNEVLFEDIIDSASLQYDSDDSFACTKTVSDKTIYTIDAVNGVTTYNVVVTVVDGLITEISTISVTNFYGQHTSQDQITFYYDKVITMPSLNDFTPAN